MHPERDDAARSWEVVVAVLLALAWCVQLVWERLA